MWCFDIITLKDIAHGLKIFQKSCSVWRASSAALTTLPEDLDSIPSTQVGGSQSIITVPWESDTLFWLLQVPGTHVVHSKHLEKHSNN